MDERQTLLQQKLQALKEQICIPVSELTAEAWVTKEPVPYTDRMQGRHIMPKTGDSWGELWDCAWFHFTGQAPDHVKGKKLVFRIDLSGEGCIFEETGTPVRGITNVASDFARYLGMPGKRIVPFTDCAAGGDRADFWLEAGCNDLFGKYCDNGTILNMEIAVCRDDARDLYYDLLVLLNTPCEQQACELIRRQLEADLVSLEKGEGVSLLAKWLPSVNASNEETVRSARRIARFLGMDERTYRKTLVRLRERIRILENNLRQRNYTFDYSKQPSKAMFKYRKAFFRNDGERYREFLEKVSRGEAGLHADTLMPYELVEPYLDYFGSMRSISEEEKQALNATWASLPRFGSGENALAVIDTSGSMYMGGKPLPASVALSLGLYFAEHNTGAFRNHFIEFSGRPQLIEIKGDTFADRLCYISSFNEVANTNLEAVFKLILKAAVRHRVPQEELPSALYIISDMEFDSCVADADETVFQNARSTFAAHGYQLPKVIFWNVQSRNLQQPVTWNEQGVALVSGCTPRLFSMVTSGQLSPLQYMLDILGEERYACITA